MQHCFLTLLWWEPCVKNVLEWHLICTWNTPTTGLFVHYPPAHEQAKCFSVPGTSASSRLFSSRPLTKHSWWGMFGMQIWKATPHFDCNLKTLYKWHRLGSSLNVRTYLTDIVGIFRKNISKSDPHFRSLYWIEFDASTVYFWNSNSVSWNKLPTQHSIGSSDHCCSWLLHF